MANEVKLDVEDVGAKRDCRGSKAARRHIKRHLPAVVEPWRQRQSHLADDLCPKVQCRCCPTPPRVGQLGPNGDGVCHGNCYCETRSPRNHEPRPPAGLLLLEERPVREQCICEPGSGCESPANPSGASVRL